MTVLQTALRLLRRRPRGDHPCAALFEPEPGDELVSLDFETTGLDPRRDEIVAVAAVVVKAKRILTSRRFEAVIRPASAPTATSIKVHGLRNRDLADGRPMRAVLPELLAFIAGRPLLGYYIDFDARMLDRAIAGQYRAWLPNRRVEVSRLYYDRKYRGAPPGTTIDLRFASILADLGIPNLGQHDALNDAVMAAEIYLQLIDMQARGARLARRREARVDVAPVGA
jgi:DNA polymerase-3 subunit epsilon